MTGTDREDSGHDDTSRRPLGLVLLGGLYLFFFLLTMSTFGHPFPFMGTILQGKPAEALVFGNLADPLSRVARLVRSPRRFRLLEHLGTHPSVYYLKGGGREHV